MAAACQMACEVEHYAIGLHKVPHPKGNQQATENVLYFSSVFICQKHGPVTLAPKHLSH